MEPLKPETKQQILANNPQAAPEDLEEYERLLSQRFTVDPHVAPTPTRSLPEPGGRAAADSPSASPDREHRNCREGSPLGPTASEAFPDRWEGTEKRTSLIIGCPAQ